MPRKQAHSGARKREIPFKLGGRRFALAPREAMRLHEFGVRHRSPLHLD
jgi:hypothetical protein